MRLLTQNKITLLLIILLSIGLTLSCSKEYDLEDGEYYVDGSWNFTDCKIETPSDTYNYPLTPDSPDWANYSIKEIWQIDQLPENVIDHISTVGLIETCLTFPYYGDIGLSSTGSYQYGFDYMVNNFNGFRELLKRNNTPDLIYERYKFMTPSCIDNNWPSFIGRGKSIRMSFMAVEIVLAQYRILAKFNSDQLTEIAREALTKYDQKNAARYSLGNLQFTLVICGRILKILNYQPFINELEGNDHLNHFLDQVGLINIESLELIRIHTENFLKGL